MGVLAALRHSRAGRQPATRLRDVVGFRLFAYTSGFCRVYREVGPFKHETAQGSAYPMQTPMSCACNGEREENVERSLLS